MDESVTKWMNELAQGDELAAQRLWQRYYEQLVRLASKRLGAARRQAADEEDVMLSAFNSFCQGIAAGRFPWLSDRRDLWKLLVTITARKATAEIRRQLRQKRGGGNECGEAALGGTGQGDGNAAIEEFVGREPTPDFAAEVAEECERLLAALGDESLRQIAIAKLEGYTNEEIAERLDCSLRTVKRRLGRVREIWGREVHFMPG